MARLASVLALACGLAASAQAGALRAAPIRLAANTSQAPMQALLTEMHAHGGSADDPDFRLLNNRLANFADAIHFAAQEKRAEHKASAEHKAAAQAKKGEGEEAPSGHAFEEIAKDKVCGKTGKLGKYSKKVKKAEDCITPCAETPGCIAFTYYQKPQKMCQLFSDCSSPEDENVIRGAYSWAVKVDGEVATGGACGKLPEYPFSKPANFQEVNTGMAHTSVAYLAGDKVKYSCVKDHTTDGSNNGDTSFFVECDDKGYYKPDKYGCVGASECGAVPCVRKTHATGKVEGTFKNPKIELVCDDGYSLDGEKVVPGGNLNNARLYLECGFNGQWMPVYDYVNKKGKACEPFNFIPASSMVKQYNKVFEVLFIASCNSELTKWAEMKETMPPKLDDKSVCSDNVAEDKKGDCESLIDDLKTLFDDAKGQKQGFDAKGFCKDMWDILKMDEPAAKTEC